MQDNNEIQSDGDAYQLPPVVLPKRAITSVKSIKEQLVTFPDIFKEQVMAIDESGIECLEYLSDNTFLAAGLGSGHIKIISAAQGKVQYILKSEDQTPVTGMAHNPNKDNIRHALMATHSGGMLQYWHSTSRQLLFKKKYQEMLQTCEISPQGTHYAFAGELGKIRIGHLNKGEPEEVETGHLGNHQNRIFCLKWNPQDNNIMLSGGWDRTVHFWDLRVKTSIKKLFGYYIGGEAIDFKGSEILLGNNKAENQLRIYDTQADKIRSLHWDITEQSQVHYTGGVFSCFFTDTQHIIACTAKKDIRLYENSRCCSEHINQDEDLRLYCMQKCGKQRRVVSGWNDGSLRYFSY